MRFKLIILVVFFIAALNSIKVKAYEPLEERIEDIMKEHTKIVKKFVKMASKKAKVAQKALQDDINLLAEVMYHENWHTDKEHLTARWTGAVVLNRVKSKGFPNSIHDVVYQKGQYAVVYKLFTVKLPEECYEMAKDLILNGAPEVPENVVFQATFYQGSGLWQEKNGEKFCYG